MLYRTAINSRLCGLTTATHLTAGVALETHAPPFTAQAIEGGQAAMHAAGTADQLERLQCLEGADDADQRREGKLASWLSSR